MAAYFLRFCSSLMMNKEGEARWGRLPLKAIFDALAITYPCHLGVSKFVFLYIETELYFGTTSSGLPDKANLWGL